MEFGKLDNIEGVNFELPPEPPGNSMHLTGLTKPLKSTIYIGATGYNMKVWRGKWYPADAKDTSFLRHYGNQFNTIEHNTTHYALPDIDTVTKWHKDTPPDFRFCPKLPQSISHARDLGVNGREIHEFCEKIVGLKEKLGPCFIQLPPYFEPNQLSTLNRFLKIWPSTIPLSIEVRHPDFFKSCEKAEAFFDLLTSNRVGTVITDVAGRRDVCHMRLTAAFVLIRFVGVGMLDLDSDRIQHWAPRIRDWIDDGISDVYFFTHMPDNILAPELAAATFSIFSPLMPNSHLRGPVQKGGVQGSLF